MRAASLVADIPPLLHAVHRRVAARLEQGRSSLGALLEAFVLQELRRLASGRPDPIDFSYYRHCDDFEVNIVLEGDGAGAGVDVKAAATVHESDLRGLRRSEQWVRRGWHLAAVCTKCDSPLRRKIAARGDA